MPPILLTARTNVIMKNKWFIQIQPSELAEFEDY